MSEIRAIMVLCLLSSSKAKMPCFQLKFLFHSQSCQESTVANFNTKLIHFLYHNKRLSTVKTPNFDRGTAVNNFYFIFCVGDLT